MTLKNIINGTKSVVRVAVHNGVFHADETLAIALIELVAERVGVEVEVSRVAHQHSDFSSFDVVSDVSGKFDGVKFFDHHQWGSADEQFGKSSAGLIYEALRAEFPAEAPKLDALVEMVDAQDIGIKQSGEFEYPNLIKRMNSQNVYSDEQFCAFRSAVEFAKTIVKALVKEAEAVAEAKEATEKAEVVKLENGGVLLELPKFVLGIGDVVNGESNEFSNIDAFIWYDEVQNKWKAQTAPDKPGSFGKSGRAIKVADVLPDGVEFVHKGEFFMVSSTRDALISYLEDYLV